MKILINTLFSLKKDSKTTGHDVSLERICVDFISGSNRSHRGK